MLSFLVQRGRCRYCGAPIRWRYFTVELLTAAYFGVLYLRCGFGLDFLAYALFGAALIAVFFIDLEHWIIPDQLSVFGIVVGLSRDGIGLALRTREPYRVPFPGSESGVPVPQAVAGIVICGGVFLAIAVLSYYVFKKEGLGGGDIKLAAAVGANLAVGQALLSFFLAVMLGSIIGVTLIVLGRKTRKDYVPFGPMMVVGAVTAILYGEQMMHMWKAYVGLDG